METYTPKILSWFRSPCSPSRDPKISENPNKRPMYDEICIITQCWGSATFHRMGEIVPRLGASLDFLRRNPQIKFLCPEGPGGRLGEFFKILDLSEDRMMTEWGRAKIVYLPRVSHCGMVNVQESQIVSMLYRQYVARHLKASVRNKLVLIRRSGHRHFTEQSAIAIVLEAAAKDYNLDYEMFIDNPVPSLHDTMRLFHSAVMVVGPHGAGLSNVYFSQPGTYVVEGVCNGPSLNFVFQRLTHVLGHHWHGIPCRAGCEGHVDVAAKDINSTVRRFLGLRKQSGISHSLKYGNTFPLH